MSDQSQAFSVGSLPQLAQPLSQPSQPVVPTVPAQPTPAQTPQPAVFPQPNNLTTQLPNNPNLGFTTPIEMSTSNSGRLQSTVVSPPTSTIPTTQPISQILEQRAPQTLQAQPIPSTNILEPTRTDPTKLAQVSLGPVPVPYTNTSANTPPAPTPFVSPPLPSTVAYVAPATNNSMPAPVQASMSTATAEPANQANPNTSPLPEVTVSEMEKTVTEPSETVQTIYKFLHLFLTLLLVLQGILGIYAAIRFIIVDFPAFEQSFNENQLSDTTIAAFITKAGLMILATAISLFFVVHMNIFHRKKFTPKIILLTLAAVIVVGFLMTGAMSTRL